MTFELIVRPEAEQDIEEAFEWYENQSAGLGEEFVLAVRSSIKLSLTALFPTKLCLVEPGVLF